MNINEMQNVAEPVYRCQHCGMESVVKEAFVPGRDLLGRPRTLCFECEMHMATLLLAAEVIAFPAAGLLFYWQAPGSWLARFALLCGSVIVLAIPLSLLHELAHVVVGQLLEFRVFSTHLGIGRAIYSKRWAGVRWVLHVVPAGGLTTLAAPALPNYRLKAFCVYLAGPALHALFAVLMLGLLRFERSFSTGALFDELWLTAAGLNLVLLFTNLFPRKVTTPAGQTVNDGQTLLDLLQDDELKLRTRHAAYYILQAREAFERNDRRAARIWVERGLELYPDDAQLLNTAGVVYQHTQELAKARQAYLLVLQRPELAASLRFIAMNNVAYTNLLMDDPTLLAQADEYTIEVIRNAPWNASLLGTRGAVLVELGQTRPGLELLHRALQKATNRRNKAEHACWIALAELKCDHPERARRYFNAARQLDPDCLLLKRVLERLEQPTVTVGIV